MPGNDEVGLKAPRAVASVLASRRAIEIEALIAADSRTVKLESEEIDRGQGGQRRSDLQRQDI